MHTYNVLLAIATNIPVLLMTGHILQKCLHLMILLKMMLTRTFFLKIVISLKRIDVKEKN